MRYLRTIIALVCALAITSGGYAGFPSIRHGFGSQVAPPSPNIKFNPGWFLGSDNHDGNSVATGGSGGNLSEIQILGTTGTGGAWTGSHFIGYSSAYSWGNLEPTAGTYNFAAISSDFNTLQQYAPGARMIIQLQWSKGNGHETINDEPWIPADILSNCSTYGAGPVGGTGCGWGLTGYNSGAGNWSIVAAAMWRPAIQARWTNLLQQLANYSFTITNGPLSGQTYTIDNNPLIEAVLDLSEDSWNFWYGPQTAADYSDAALLAGFQNEMTTATASAAFAHTQYATFQSFGWANDAFPSPSLPPLIAYAAANRNSLSNADVFPPTSGVCGVTGICAQETYIGLVWNGSAWVSGGTDYRPTMAYIGNMQPPDYQANPGTTIPQIYTNLTLLQAPYGIWTIWDESTGTPASFTSTYLVPFVNTHNVPNTTRPSNLNYLLLLAMIRRRKAANDESFEQAEAA